MKGKLWVLEGLDGSGKATQTELLCAELTRRSIPHRQVSFPDYADPSSTLVRMYLKGEFGRLADVSPYGASLFYAVDRYASFRSRWGADYEAGTLIVADRYTTSNVGHQMSRLPREEWDGYLAWLEDTEYVRMGLPRPDRVIYLDADPEVSGRLLSVRYRGDESRRDLHEADAAYLLHCREAALYGAAVCGWTVLSCTGDGGMRPREEIAAEVLEALRPDGGGSGT